MWIGSEGNPNLKQWPAIYPTNVGAHRYIYIYIMSSHVSFKVWQTA